MVTLIPVQEIANLVLGRACRGCGRVGRDLCEACLAEARVNPRTLSVPRVGVPAWAAAPYSGTARHLVLAYKGGQRSLAGPLGLLLADAVRAALDRLQAHGATLVPIPGHRRPGRGFDALAGVTSVAVRDLREAGWEVAMVRALDLRSDYRPVKSLGRTARLEALAGAFVASHRVHALRPGAPLLVVDDVVTTGATLAQAVAALRAGGCPPWGACVVAAA